ncbi:hypothetical protein ACFL6C_09240 [Myxococcota bacterium]
MSRVGFITLLAFGCSDDSRPTGEGPIAPEPPELSSWTCPSGWSQSPGFSNEDGSEAIVQGVGGFSICQPPEQLHCPPGEAQWLGQSTCERVGTSCPSGDFHDEASIRALAARFPGRVWYIKAGASDGTGTRAQPFGALSAGLTAAGDGDILALSVGVFQEATIVRKAVAVVGSCVDGTTVSGSGPVDDEATLEFIGASGATLLTNFRVGGERIGIINRNTLIDLRIESLEVRDTMFSGLYFSNWAAAELIDVVVRDTQSWIDGLTGGIGMTIVGGAEVNANRVVFERNHSGGVVVGQLLSKLFIHGAVIRDTQPMEANGLFGTGIEALEGGTVMGEHVLVASNHRFGVIVRDLHSRLELDDAHLHDTMLDSDEGYGEGLAVTLEATADVRRTLVTASQGNGVGVSFGGIATLEDVVIRNTAVVPAGSTPGFGFGVMVGEGGELEANRLVLERNACIGMAVINEGLVSVSDFVARDTRDSADELEHSGVGILAESGSVATIARAHLEGGRSGAIEAFGAGTVITLEHTIARGVESRLSDGQFGSGLVVTNGATASASESIFERTRYVGIIAAGGGTTVQLNRVIVSQTAPGKCADVPPGQVGSCVVDGVSFGVGSGLVSLVNAYVDLRNFEISHSALAGIQVGQDARVRALHGEIHHNTIGLNVQGSGFDFESIDDSVIFRDNGVDLDSAELPIPQPLQGLEL